MAYTGYECLDIHVDRGVATVTIDHPPINLFDLTLIQEMDRVGRELEADGDVRVVVFQSANPQFFTAHADVPLIQPLPTPVPPKAPRLGPFHAMVDRFRTMPKATIGKIEGRARGGGSEFLLSLDMRFGAIGRAILSQPEVAIGIIPGGSGTQRLPRLVGRSRALEVILGCEDFPAELAERYGYLNRALPAAELGPLRRAPGPPDRLLPGRGDRAREGLRQRRRAADLRGAPRGGALLQPGARDQAGAGADA